MSLHLLPWCWDPNLFVFCNKVRSRVSVKNSLKSCSVVYTAPWMSSGPGVRAGRKVGWVGKWSSVFSSSQGLASSSASADAWPWPWPLPRPRPLALPLPRALAATLFCEGPAFSSSSSSPSPPSRLLFLPLETLGCHSSSLSLKQHREKINNEKHVIHSVNNMHSLLTVFTSKFSHVIATGSFPLACLSHRPHCSHLLLCETSPSITHSRCFTPTPNTTSVHVLPVVVHSPPHTHPHPTHKHTPEK